MRSSPSRRLFCFGLGYSGRHLAATLSAEGWRIAGTVRSATAATALEAEGYEVYRFDGSAPLPDAGTALSGTTHLLASAPPGPDGDPVLRHHAADLAALANVEWAGYLSTTGVYGDRGGGWVDEASARTPSGPRGKRRVEAENGWLGLWRDHGLPVHLFRLAGIYGPGRSALDTVRSGKARRIVKPGQVFSRIHVDDITAVLRASMAQPNPGAAYNLCDDEAAAPQDVIAYACHVLGVTPPPEVPFDSAELSNMARSFYDDNKRVSNARIREELGVALRWPNYREGLEGLRR